MTKICFILLCVLNVTCSCNSDGNDGIEFEKPQGGIPIAAYSFSYDTHSIYVVDIVQARFAGAIKLNENLGLGGDFAVSKTGRFLIGNLFTNSFYKIDPADYSDTTVVLPTGYSGWWVALSDVSSNIYTIVQRQDSNARLIAYNDQLKSIITDITLPIETPQFLKVSPDEKWASFSRYPDGNSNTFYLVNLASKQIYSFQFKDYLQPAAFTKSSQSCYVYSYITGLVHHVDLNTLTDKVIYDNHLPSGHGFFATLNSIAHTDEMILVTSSSLITSQKPFGGDSTFVYRLDRNGLVSDTILNFPRSAFSAFIDDSTLCFIQRPPHYKDFEHSVPLRMENVVFRYFNIRTWNMIRESTISIPEEFTNNSTNFFIAF